jgi:3-hydroxymyristoyl/3-hydroxydecanoyl-(acyl carrier protein) dehydratase
VSFEAHTVIAENHPALAGHFPGNPVVPGVVILDEVLSIVRRWRGECRVVEIPTVKFTAPLEPGVPFTVRLRETTGSGIAFECLAHGRTLASGRMVVELHGAPG